MRTAQLFAVELPASSQDGFLGSRKECGHPPDPARQDSLHCVLTILSFVQTFRQGAKVTVLDA